MLFLALATKNPPAMRQLNKQMPAPYFNAFCPALVFGFVKSGMRKLSLKLRGSAALAGTGFCKYLMSCRAFEMFFLGTIAIGVILSEISGMLKKDDFLFDSLLIFG